MANSSLESDWLQDTLTDVAGRLRRSSDELTRCAQQLEQIVTDLQSPEEAFVRPRPAAATGARDDNYSLKHSQRLTVTISLGTQP